MVQNGEDKKTESKQLSYKVDTQIQGLLIRLHGRIPREPVRPRKTIQSKMLGTSSSKFMLSKSYIRGMKPVTGVNPELGTFSIWVQCII